MKRLRNSGAAQRVMSWYMVAFAIMVGWLQAVFTHGKLLPDDWASLWVAGELHADGLDSELYRRDPDDFAFAVGQAWSSYSEDLDYILMAHPFVHNPLIAHWMSGWTHLQSFEDSVYTLTFLSGIAAVVLIASAYFVWFRQQISFPLLVGATMLLLINPMYQNGIWLGQTSALIYGLVFLSLALARTPRWWQAVIAGVLLAFAGFIKLTPLLLIPVLLFFRDSRKSGIVATATTALFAIWSCLVVDFSVQQTWWKNLQDLNDAVLLSVNNQSMPAWILEGERTETNIVDVLHDPDTWATLTPLLIALVLGLLFAAYAWIDRTNAFAVIAVGGFTLATLFGRIVWTHYYIVLVGLVFGILALGAHRKYILVLTSLGLFLFYPPIGTQIGGSNPFGLAYHGLLAAMILLGVFVIAMAHNVLEHYLQPAQRTSRKSTPAKTTAA